MAETNPEDQRPSDTEASHEPNEGSSQRDPSLAGEPRTYQGQGRQAPGRDRSRDYGGDGPDPAAAQTRAGEDTPRRDVEPEIAADDAGASAAAEMMGKARLREH